MKDDKLFPKVTFKNQEAILKLKKMTKEESSEKYIQGKLRDHKEYPLCDDKHRMRLITKDLYDIQQAFEDGYECAMKNAIEWLYHNMKDTCYVGMNGTLSKPDFIQSFKETI